MGGPAKEFVSAWVRRAALETTWLRTVVAFDQAWSAGDHTGGLLPFLGKNEHAGIKMKQAFGDGFVGMGVGRVIEVADD
jgi:hypothetical protein